MAGEMWRAFLDPFTDGAQSLSQALTDLSKFAHLAFYFYRQHGSSFLSYQLHADLQTIVKAAFFCRSTRSGSVQEHRGDIALLHLETLVLEAGSDGFNEHFLKSIVAPSLLCFKLPERLKIEHPTDAGVIDIFESLEAFILKSGCHLQELEITDACNDPDYYRARFPSIRVIVK
ncbi:hypothetical protein R3P38DRAFT_3222680 [Favolaschia claudopus]|uniref:Uncharacterized protein n=1 Tax=Favolaschia claudopus TaxID=2862362 RepID=A0AAV9ZY15_9AGAR